MIDTTRDLIQRMATVLDLYVQMARDDCRSTHPFSDEARAYLSQPEPEGHTRAEMETMLYYEFTTSTGHGERIDPIGFARAYAARWGRPAVKPVPVSERPWEREGWCDNNGWCWGFDADDTDPFWSFDRPETCACWTHLLPHYALPIPTFTETP